jgi:hypothetical protein
VELVASRLAGLAPGTVAVIELLAAGEPVGVPVLEKITDPAGLEDADAGLVLGEARFRSGQHAEAESVLARMVPLCRTDRERALIASARAHNFHNLMGDPGAARTVLDEALAVVTDDPARLQVLGRLATIRLFETDPEGALAGHAALRYIRAARTPPDGPPSLPRRSARAARRFWLSEPSA